MFWGNAVRFPVQSAIGLADRNPQAEIEAPAGEVVEHSAPANFFRTSKGVADGCSRPAAI
jgi:hypothetical protein